MRREQRGPGPLTGRRGGDPVLWRFPVVLALLMLAAAGTRAREVIRLTSEGMLSPTQPTMFVIGVVIIVLATLGVVAALIGLVQILTSRHGPAGVAGKDDSARLPWWARALLALGAVSLPAILITVLVLLFMSSRRRRPRHLPPLRQGAPRGAAPLVHPGTVTAMLVTSLAILLVLAAAWFWRWRARRAQLAPAEREPSVLATAVSAGRSALHRPRNAREAIIACYAAMEDTLAGAGTARKPADTPEDLLARAAGEGLLRGPAAGRLTVLFSEARFSPHLVGDAERHEATAALDDIGRDLAAGP